MKKNLLSVAIAILLSCLSVGAMIPAAFDHEAGSNKAAFAGTLSATELNPFGMVCINTAATHTFAINGTDLTTDNIMVGPLTGFTFSATGQEGTFQNVLSITQPGGNFSQVIYVRFAPTATMDYDGGIVVTGGGAPSTVVGAAGSGVNTAPVLAITSAYALTVTSANFTGEITSSGCSPLIERGFVYSESENPVIGGAGVSRIVATGTSIGTFSAVGLSLVAETTYYVRAYATNNGGTTYGSEAQFTTAGIAAPLALAATDILSSSFNANWEDVAGAEKYYLDVATTPTFVNDTFDNVVGWNFPDVFADNTADSGITANSNKQIEAVGANTVTYIEAGATTRAASATGWHNGNSVKYWEIGFSTLGYYNLKISSKQYSSATGPKNFQLQYKIGVDGAYYDITGGTITVGENWNEGVLNNITLPASAGNRPVVYVRWVMTSNTSINGGAVNFLGESAIDDIVVEGTADTYVPGYINLEVTDNYKIVSGLNTSANNYYYRVRAEANGNATDYSNTIAVKEPNYWNGTAWSLGVSPTIADRAVIQGDYNTAVHAELEAYNLIVNTGNVVVADGTAVTLQNELKVNGGTFTVHNGGQLVQKGDGTVPNTGNITFYKNSNDLYRLDYTMWASPVSGTQTLKQFSPNTLNNRFYIYDTSLNQFVGIVQGVLDPVTATFSSGKGYLIRTPDNHSAYPTASAYEGKFTGVPNNGSITFTMQNIGQGQRYNLVGNPYPSAISIADFIADNVVNVTGTLWYWRKTNGAAGSAYVTYSGGTFSNGPGEPYILPGQGFIVEAFDNSTTVTFNNKMRINEGGPFFRMSGNATAEKHRIWLNLNDAGGTIGHMAIAYTEGATEGFDNGLDGKLMKDSNVALASVVNDMQLSVQARPLPFTGQDVVPLSFQTNAPGTYSISLNTVDGLFEGNQDIYLKDNNTGSVHNLKSGAYSFATEEGMFNNRFEIVYTIPALGTNDPVANDDTVVLWQNSNSININAGNTEITGILVYDMRGRVLYNNDGVNATAATITDLQSVQQVLLVEIITTKGKINKKIIF
jgi:hypothetical protein